MRLAPNPPIWSAQQRSAFPVNSLKKHFSLIFSGLFRVDGTVKVAGSPDVPIRRKVCLVEKKSRRIANETWSDAASGAYTFSSVKQGPWVVLAFDHTGEYNAVVADNISGTLM